jgi:hypothetical protein
MPAAGFEPAIPVTKQLQTYALDCTTNIMYIPVNYYNIFKRNLLNLTHSMYFFMVYLMMLSVAYLHRDKMIQD